MAAQLDVTRGNDRRKALLQMLMQKQGAPGGAPGPGGGAGFGAGSAVASIPFGGMRANPKNRSSDGQSFVHPSQVAAAFLGGLGAGGAGRPGAQGGADGSPVSRFLPTDGGPVERRVGPYLRPQDAPQPSQTPATPQAPDGGPTLPPGNLQGQAPQFVQPPPMPQGPTGPTPGIVDYLHQQMAGQTPTTGASQLIPLGNGAYFDPATGAVHYPNSQSTAL